jgi:hypothetical protein
MRVFGWLYKTSASFGKRLEPEGPNKRQCREDLEPICFEYVSAIGLVIEVMRKIVSRRLGSLPPTGLMPIISRSR